MVSCVVMELQIAKLAWLQNYKCVRMSHAYTYCTSIGTHARMKVEKEATCESNSKATQK